MLQQELDHQVAQTTGESVATISSLGFVPLTAQPYEREPLTVDWDELEQNRDVLFPV